MADRATIPTEANFNAGRDLGFSYIREAIEADAHPPDDDRVYYATGLLRKFLDRLKEAPELIDGFDAYLTATVGVLQHSAPNVSEPWLQHRAVYGPDFDFLEPDEAATNVLQFPNRTASNCK